MSTNLEWLCSEKQDEIEKFILKAVDNVEFNCDDCFLNGSGRCNKYCIDSVRKWLNEQHDDGVFDWDGFENREFAVHCRNIELIDDFLSEANSHGYIDLDSYECWSMYKNELCIACGVQGAPTLSYGVKYIYQNRNGMNIIEWEKK